MVQVVDNLRNSPGAGVKLMMGLAGVEDRGATSTNGRT